MNGIAAYGLLAHGVIVGAMTALLPFGEWRARVALAATTMAMLVGIAPAMHGFFGAPSVSLLVLAIFQLADRRPSPLGYPAALTILLFATPFYAASLGGGLFDPYALGYHPGTLLAALLPFGLLLWWKRLDGWLIVLTADLAGYGSGIFANLWDVLFDPMLVLLAAAIVVHRRLIPIIAARSR